MESNELLKTVIQKRQVTYYLTTENDLETIKDNNILSQIFCLFTSVTAGGIVSWLISGLTNINISEETKQTKSLLIIFTILTVLFLMLTIYFLCKSSRAINKIMKSGSVTSFNINSEECERAEAGIMAAAVEQEGELIITNARYMTKNHSIDVTEELNEMIHNNILETMASNDIKGDPDCGIVKIMELEYKYKGMKFRKLYNEGEIIRLP